MPLRDGWGGRRARLASDTGGASAVQHVILVGVVALVALVGFRYFGGALTRLTHAEGENVRTLTPDCQGSTDCGGGTGHDSAPTAASPTQGGNGGGPIVGGPAVAGAASRGGPLPGARGAGMGAEPGMATAAPFAPGEAPSPSLAQRCLGSNLCAGAAGATLGFLQGRTPGGFLTNLLPQPESVKNNAAYQYWNGAGQVAGGIAAATTGAATEVVGGALDATGVGAIVGVPVNAAGAVVIASGATSVVAGAAQMADAGHLMQNQAAPGPSTGDPRVQPEPPRPETPQAETPNSEPPTEPGAPPEMTGETSATRIGKDVHEKNAAARRASGNWDEVNQQIRGSDGRPIQVARKTNLKTGEPVGTDTQAAQPDAVSYKRGEILDDKPAGRPISKDRQELIRNIEAYRQRTGELPKEIVIERYDPKTGAPAGREIYKPQDILPKGST